MPERPAALAAVTLAPAADEDDGIGAGGPRWIDIPPVTLNPKGDWSLFLVTKSPSGNYTSGTVLDIGPVSNSTFAQNGQLALTWCSPYPNPWDSGTFSRTFVVTGRDQDGTPVSDREMTGTGFFGAMGVNPLVGQANLDDDRPRGLAVLCRHGRLEFWTVDQGGAQLMDIGSLGQEFHGLVNQPVRIGAALLKDQTTWPPTYWGQPVQALVIDNGACITPHQMNRLFAGADALNLLNLNPGFGDRYYPGTITGGQWDELVAGKVGTITGTAAPATSLLSWRPPDDVQVDMDGHGQVVPCETWAPPAPDGAPARSAIKVWGTRIGPKTDIRLRVVRWNAPDPLADPEDAVTGWTTIATGVSDGQTWCGDLPNVPIAFADYDLEASWRDIYGQWTSPKRMYRRFCVGITLTIYGQTVLRQLRDYEGEQRSLNPSVAGFLREYVDWNPFGGGDCTRTQGWRDLYTPLDPRTSGLEYGEKRLAEKLALMTNSPVGIGNFAFGEAPLGGFGGGTSESWARWKRFIQRDRPQYLLFQVGEADLTLAHDDQLKCLDIVFGTYDAAVQSAPGGPWKYQWLVCPLTGDWKNRPGGPGTRAYDAEWVKTRAALGKPVALAGWIPDVKTADGEQPTPDDLGSGLIASRAAQTIAWALGAAPYSGLGPSWDENHSTWHQDGSELTIDLALTQNGGTGLVTGLTATPIPPFHPVTPDMDDPPVATTAPTPSGPEAQPAATPLATPPPLSPDAFEVSCNDGPYTVPDTFTILDATHVRLTLNLAASPPPGNPALLVTPPGDATGLANQPAAGMGTPPAGSAIPVVNSVAITYLAAEPGGDSIRHKSWTQAAGIPVALYDNRGDAITGLPGFPVEPVTLAAPLHLAQGQ